MATEKIARIEIGLVSGKVMKFMGADAKAASIEINRVWGNGAEVAIFFSDELNIKIQIKRQYIEYTEEFYGVETTW